MPTVSRQVVVLLHPADEVVGQALVDEHRRVPERERTPGDRRQLHGVLEQARPGREAGAREVGGPGIVLHHRLTDPRVVEPEVVRDREVLVGRSELDVAPGVREELGQLGLLGIQLDDGLGEPAEQRCGPRPCAIVSRGPRSAGG